MKLYYAPGACSLAPHIVSREAGVALDLVKVDLRTHLTGTGIDYTTINPKGYVPAIELDDGALLTETAILVQWIADKKPESGLLPPQGTLARFRVQEWLNFVATELHKTFTPWLWHKDTAASARDTALAILARRFAHLDQALSGRPHLTGEAFTAADAYAFTIVRWSNILKVDLTPHPNLRAFMDRVAARPAVRAALAAEGLIRRTA